MRLARVQSTIVSTRKHESFEGLKLLAVELLNSDQTGTGNVLVAIDHVQAGIGDLVLILQEGSSSRQILDGPDPPYHCVIVGIVDAVD